MFKLSLLLTVLLCMYSISTDAQATGDSTYLIKARKATTSDSARYYYLRHTRVQQAQLNWVEQARSLQFVANLWITDGKPDSAVPYIQESIETYRTKRPEDSVAISKLYLQLNSCHLALEQYVPAKESIETCIEMLSEPAKSNPMLLAEPYTLKGIYHSRMGDPLNQLKSYFAVLDILNQYPIDSVRADLAITYSNIGVALHNFSRFTEELDFLNKSLEVRANEKVVDTPWLATTYNNIAYCYRGMGDYDKAITFAKKALELRKLFYKDPKSMILAEAFNNVAYSYGDELPDIQLEYLDKAFSICIENEKTKNRAAAFILSNIGYAWGLKDNYTKQLVFYRQVFEIDSAMYGIENRRTAEDIYNIAYCYERLGQNKIADSIYIEALQIQRRIIPSYSTALALTYAGRARCLSKLNRHSEALNNIQLALSSLGDSSVLNSLKQNPEINAIPDKSTLLSMLRCKAEIAFKASGDSYQKKTCLEVALDAANKANDAIDILRRGYTSEFSKIRLKENHVNLFNTGMAVSYELYRLTGQQFYLESTYRFSERNKAMLLRERISDQKLLKLSGVPDSMLNQMNDYALRVSFLGRFLLNRKLSSDIRSEYENEYINAKIKHEAAINDVRAHAANKQYAIVDSDRFDVSAFQSQMDSVTSVVEYTIDNDSIYIFVINHQYFYAIKKYVGKNFDGLINDYLQALNRSTSISDPDITSRSTALYKMLIGPIRTQLTNTKTLVVIPGGILNYLPFETLTPSARLSSRSRPRLLIDEYDISYNYASALLLSQGSKSPCANSFIGFAPSFGNNGTDKSISKKEDEQRKREGFASTLREGKKEIEAITTLFKQHGREALNYQDADATKGEFLRSISDYGFIHVVSHGFVNDVTPELSGIVFTKAPTETAEHDYILYSDEMYSLNLKCADLVVLSSCQSGIGKIYKGEGVISLARGVLFSGSPNIILSLWRVPDDATHALMVQFYKNVLSGSDYSHSLQKAKHALLSNKNTAAPKNWAGFTLIRSLN